MQAPDPAPLPADATLEQQVIAAIRRVYDPEIPLNVYDLGLIYDLQINDQKEVAIKMTLTAPGCPVAGILPGQVADAVRAVEGISDAQVELVWDPPWNQDRMSDEAKLTLGLF
ncbi:MAG: SUF system Fe-S cluster assembly protein [Gammaproteobacteria bacterium]|nr:SUF system Fe-S cluster assembly protein [Gammaproteobacteria bacterium]